MLSHSLAHFVLFTCACRKKKSTTRMKTSVGSQIVFRVNVRDDFLLRISMINDSVSDFWRVLDFISYLRSHPLRALKPCNFKLFSYTIDGNKKKGDTQKATNLIFHLSRSEIFICRLRAVQDWLDLMFMQSMKNYCVMLQHLSYFSSDASCCRRLKSSIREKRNEI